MRACVSQEVRGKISPKNIPNSNNYLKMSTKFCRNDVWKLLEINRDRPFIDHLSETTKNFLGHLSWTPCLQICSWELCFGTLDWEPVLGNLWESLGTCSWEPCLGTWLGNLLFGTLLRNLFFGTLGTLGTCSWEPCLGTLLRNLAWEPCFGTSS